MITSLIRLSFVSNLLSFIRGPLALLFLYKSTLIRFFALTLAIATDFLDGFIARRFKTVSPLGTILDPLMDRVFVITALSILFQENKIHPLEITALLTRDCILFITMLYLKMTGKWGGLKYTATFWGKVTTLGQFSVLGFLILGLTVPIYFYLAFIGIALLLARELLLLVAQFNHAQTQTKEK